VSYEGARRMGIKFGSSYGELVDSVIDSIGHACTRDDFLRLAWACVDQASSSIDRRLADEAMTAIEVMYDAEPETLRTGRDP
jgi:hypothetical protein